MTEHIQINDVLPRIHYVADGVQSAYSFPFPIFKTSDLEVWLDGGLQTFGFTVSGAGISSGGTAIFAVPPPPGAGVTLRRRLTLARTTDYQADGLIRAKTLNDELDFQIAAVQQVAEELGRAVKRAPASPSSADVTLPEPAPRRALRWNDDGTGLTNTAFDPDAAGDAAQAAATATAARDVAVAAKDQTVAAVGAVRVSANDAVAGPLAVKLVAGEGISLTEGGDGGDERLTIALAAIGGDPWTDLGAGTALVLDGAGAANLTYVMTGTTTVSATNLEPGKVYAFMVKLHQDATGGRAFTLPAGTVWPYGEVPTWPTGAGKYSVFVLSTWDAGASWLASFVGAEYA